MDSYDMSPLCPAYDTPIYTKAFQDLLASTVDDYDEDRVLNLDDDKTTNFAVFADETILVDSSSGMNVVTSADNENLVYVIENADSTVTSLKVGDVFTCPGEGDEVIIVKVAAISVKGTTVTITGGELEMEDVFSHVKIENESDTTDIVVDTSTADEGVTYEGLVSDGPVARSLEGGGSAKLSHEFKLDKTIKNESEDEDDWVEASLTIKGSLKFELSADIKYYIATKNQFVEFKFTPAIIGTLKVSGEVAVNIPLGSLSITAIPGVKIGFKPKVVFEFDGTIEAKVTYSATLGIAYYSDSGIKNLSKPANVNAEVKAEAKFFFGVDFAPVVSFVSEDFAKLEITALIGVEVSVKAQGLKYEVYKQPDVYHNCQECFDIKLEFKAELSGKLVFLDMDKLTIGIKIGEFKIPFGNLYWSSDRNEGGKGDCPNKLSKNTIIVYTKDKKPVPDALVKLELKSLFNRETVEEKTTDKNGSTYFYLPCGRYTVSAVFNGNTYSRDFVASSIGQKIAVYEEESYNVSNDSNTVTDNIIINTGNTESKEDYKDYGTLVNSGSCGDNASWKFYSSGLLVISGTGEMRDYDLTCAPWFVYYENIKEVKIKNGITSIGETAFYLCQSLESITIPDSVTSIGEDAFSCCTSLTSITIPQGVTSIDFWAFFACESLTRITIPKGITSIRDCAFGWCENLTSITFLGNAPDFGMSVFDDVTATAYYPEGNSTWTEDLMQNYGGSITWVSYIPTYSASVVSVEQEEPVLYTVEAEESYSTYLASSVEEYSVSPMSVYPGDYGTEDGSDVKTASFEGLVPGGEYVLLVLRDMSAEDTLGAENLLYIAQGTALEDGTLTFRYIPKEDIGTSYIIACGASDKNLEDAIITFPEMEASSETRVVEPTVEYDGETLIEGVDYIILGQVDYSEGGTYTCYIRGIYDYSGIVTCTYTVTAVFTFGDINSDGVVNGKDSNVLTKILSGAQSATEIERLAADVNCDGMINGIDANYIARYISGNISEFV